MEFTRGDIEPHKRYLAEVPLDVVRRRLEMFRLQENVINVAPIICIADKISEKFAKWREYVHPLDPISLDDLKNWFGVPNEVARQHLRSTRILSAEGNLQGPLKRVNVPNLPMQQDFEFGALGQEQRLAVKQMAMYLLHGYVDPEEAARPPLSGIINFMISQAKTLRPKLFVAPDLIICPDHEIEFQGTPALFFNNILINGNGQLTVSKDTKIHAVQILHIAA